MIELRALSLGAGVQSTVVLLMSCRGELDRVDAAIFADTGWETQRTYRHLAWLEQEAARYGIPVHRVTAGNIRADGMRSRIRGLKGDGMRWAAMPLYTANNGSTGMVRRQCTKEYKIAPIVRKQRELLGAPRLGRVPGGKQAEVWFGISLDEVQRMREPSVAWQIYRYPLIHDEPMRRNACQAWFEKRYPNRDLPRSACIGCPFRSNSEWQELRNSSADEWADAIAFDEALRDNTKVEGVPGQLDGLAYLHRSCKPLAEAPIGDDEPLLWGNECEGLCGV